VVGHWGYPAVNAVVAVSAGVHAIEHGAEAVRGSLRGAMVTGGLAWEEAECRLEGGRQAQYRISRRADVRWPEAAPPGVVTASFDVKLAGRRIPAAVGSVTRSVGGQGGGICPLGSAATPEGFSTPCACICVLVRTCAGTSGSFCGRSCDALGPSLRRPRVDRTSSSSEGAGPHRRTVRCPVVPGTCAIPSIQGRCGPVSRGLPGTRRSPASTVEPGGSIGVDRFTRVAQIVRLYRKMERLDPADHSKRR
jgi:hypothetical protein